MSDEYIIAQLQNSLTNAVTREVQLRERLKEAQEVNFNLSRDLDAYRLKVFGVIGGGIDCSNFELILVCKRCGYPASPIDHVCTEFS